MRIRAVSVFEGVVYHCHAVDTANPCTPTLEVDALTRPGDTDAGPLLVSMADYERMLGSAVAAECEERLRRKGRLVDHQGIVHIAFPTWTVVAE